jgi:hypothetical protein
MNDLDIRLAAALNAGSPPAQDARFRIEVLLRIERARFKQRVVTALVPAFATAALAGASTQAIEAWGVEDTWRFWIVALGAVAAMFAVSGVSIEALPGLRGLARALGPWLHHP